MHTHPTPVLPFIGKLFDVQQIAAFIHNTARVSMSIVGSMLR